MTITFNSVDMGGQAADCTDAPSGFALWEEEIVQEDALIGGTQPARYARGNRITLEEWSLTRTHASVAAAGVFMLTHPADLRGLGTLTITETDGTTTTKTLTACRISMGKPSQRGKTTRHSYSARGLMS